MIPTLLLRAPGLVRALPLAASTLVGRHPAAHVRVEGPRIPLLWLEIRWHGSVWGWRAVGALDRTRGTGAALPDGWRTFAAGARLRLEDVLSVELVTDSAPIAMLVDPDTSELAPPDVLERLVEMREGRLIPVAAEGDTTAALADGEILADPARERRAPGRVAGWRICLPDAPPPTVQARIDLARPYTLAFDDGDTHVTLLQGDASASVRGECARVLAVFVAARRDDLPTGGWLTPLAAWDAWVARGGNPESPVARLSWERAKLRQQLAKQGVAGLDGLFEVERLPAVRVRWSPPRT